MIIIQRDWREQYQNMVCFRNMYLIVIQCDNKKDVQTKRNSNRTLFVIRLQCLATNCSSFTAAGMDGDQHMLSAFATISDMRNCPLLEHELCEMHHHGKQALAVPAQWFDKLV